MLLTQQVLLVILLAIHVPAILLPILDFTVLLLHISMAIPMSVATLFQHQLVDTILVLHQTHLETCMFKILYQLIRLVNLQMQVS